MVTVTQGRAVPLLCAGAELAASRVLCTCPKGSSWLCDSTAMICEGIVRSLCSLCWLWASVRRKQ